MFIQNLMQGPGDVLNAWVRQANQYAHHAKAAIFTTSFKASDPYLRAADQMLPPGAVRTRKSGSDASWTLVSGATLTLEWIPHIYEAHRHGGRSYSLIAFDDPVAWTQPNLIDYLLSTLRSATGVPTELIAVATPIRSSLVHPVTAGTGTASAASTSPATAAPDFFAINRDFCR
jgi:hypothetical protein